MDDVYQLYGTVTCKVDVEQGENALAFCWNQLNALCRGSLNYSFGVMIRVKVICISVQCGPQIYNNNTRLQSARSAFNFTT